MDRWLGQSRMHMTEGVAFRPLARGAPRQCRQGRQEAGTPRGAMHTGRTTQAMHLQMASSGKARRHAGGDSVLLAKARPPKKKNKMAAGRLNRSTTAE